MIGYFVRHPNAANLLMAALMILGVMVLPTLKRETLPEVANDEVEIRVVYRGATADEVEDAICRRLEDALEGATDLIEVRCEAKEGLAVATAVMNEGAQMMRFLDDVKSEVEAIDDFPEDAEEPVIGELGQTELVVSIAVTGPEDATDLKTYAEDLKSRLLRLEEVADVSLRGFSERHIRIEIPAQRLREYGVSAADIAIAVGRQSVGGPAGRLEGGEEDILLRFDDQRKTVDAFRDLAVISSQSGAEIPLGHIARITDTFDRPEDSVLFNGRRAALLDIQKTRAQDVLVVMDAVTDFVEAEKARTAAGIELALTRDQSSVVRDRLELVMRNGAQGLALVFLTLWLFFNLRYSFWVTMGLPVSFLGAFFILSYMGVSLNMISMVGLLIGIGLLMDDAIVISENIAARRAEGDSPFQAATEGTKQVMPGILSSFATTILVFGALAFIDGDLGQILKVMPVVLIVVLAVSLVEAFLILPHHLAHSLGHVERHEPSRFRSRFEASFGHFRESVFGRLLDRAIDYRYFTVGVVLMLMLMSVSVLAGGGIRFIGFPDLEGDVVEARVLLPQGTPLHRTEQVVQQITNALDRVNEAFKPRQPGERDLVTNVAVIFGQNPDAYETGPHVVQISADLLGAEIRDAPIVEVLNHWRDGVGVVPDVIALKYTEPAIGPAGRAIDIRLKGYDLARLKQASDELQVWLAGYDGVNDLTDDLRPGKREYRLRLKPGAGALGLDARAVADQVRTAYQGVAVDEFPVGPETYEVNLRLMADERRGPDDLESLIIVGRDGALIPLQAVVEVEESRGWARIHRVDGLHAVSVQGDVDIGITNAGEVRAETTATFMPELLQRYPDITYSLEGEAKESGQTGQSLGRNVLMGLIGVYFLLAFQFRSYLTPLAVMVIIPTAFIGVIWGHLLVGIDLSMPSLVATTSLAGVVVNNSILLVQFLLAARASGMSVEEAARRAGRNRFRPILLTTLTTVAGVTPLLLERSLQAQILIPIAASLAFGLATGAIIALFLVPALFCILDDVGMLAESE